MIGASKRKKTDQSTQKNTNQAEGSIFGWVWDGYLQVFRTKYPPQWEDQSMQYHPNMVHLCKPACRCMGPFHIDTSRWVFPTTWTPSNAWFPMALLKMIKFARFRGPPCRMHPNWIICVTSATIRSTVCGSTWLTGKKDKGLAPL